MPTTPPATDSHDGWPIPDDIVCTFPDDLARYVHEHGTLPEDVTYDENFLCVWSGERFFVHAYATLPLIDEGQGVGFGLWVEVTPDDFSRLLNALEDDELYKTLAFEGVLANDWPGFPGTLGLKVAARATEVGQKVRIEAVLAEMEEIAGLLHLFMHIPLDEVPALREYLYDHMPDYFDEYPT